MVQRVPAAECGRGRSQHDPDHGGIVPKAGGHKRRVVGWRVKEIFYANGRVTPEMLGDKHMGLARKAAIQMGRSQGTAGQTHDANTRGPGFPDLIMIGPTKKAYSNGKSLKALGSGCSSSSWTQLPFLPLALEQHQRVFERRPTSPAIYIQIAIRPVNGDLHTKPGKPRALA